MVVVVNDANILIDLIKLDLLHEFFALNWKFYTTDLIVYDELYDEQVMRLQPFIKSKQLIIQDFDANDMRQIIRLTQQKPQLSDKDCSAFYTAQKLKAALLTSDNNLRKFALSNFMEVHGHLWVFDALVEQGCISADAAIQKLSDLNKINSRLKLPKEECERRLKQWRQLR